MSMQRFRTKPVLIILLIVALFIIGYQLGTLLATSDNDEEEPITLNSEPASPSAGAVVIPPQMVNDFTLTGKTGDPMHFNDLRGNAVLLFFGYTHCPDVCPTTLADFRLVKRYLGETAESVKFVFISVDGKRDTPEVVRQYLSAFDEEFIGMTGDPDQLREIGQVFGLFFAEEAVTEDQNLEHGEDEALDAQNYFVQHTSPSFLIDPDGYLKIVYFYGTDPEIIAGGISSLLQEPNSGTP